MERPTIKKMTKAETILIKNLRKNGCYNVQIVQEEILQGVLDSINEALTIPVVVSSCVNKETLIKDLDDKRIVGVTLNEDMWYYCRKETAEHLLDKYEIKTK